jgi:two-component system sensor histidine kinase YesM
MCIRCHKEGPSGNEGHFFFSLAHKLWVSDAVSIIVPLIIFGIILNVISSRILLDKVSKSNTDMMTQLGNHIDTAINDIDSISLLIIMQNEVSELRRLDPVTDSVRFQALEKKISDMITYLKTSKSYISSIHLEYNNGKRINGVRNISVNKTLIGFTGGEMHTLSAENGGGLWIVKHGYADIPGQSLSFGRVIKDFRNLVTQIGYIEVCIDENVFTEIYRRSQNALDGDFYLLDQNHTVLSSTNKGTLGKPLDDFVPDYNKIMQGTKGFYFQKINNINYLVSYYKTRQENWLIINVVDTKKLLQDNRVITFIMVFGVLVAIVICMFTTGYFSNRVLEPLRTLQKEMRKFEEGNFGARIIASGHDEISEIGESFNRMVVRLNQTMNKLYISELSQKESELSALQSQINPHFLYNTLDTIYWISREEHATGSAELIKALSVLFRISLNNGRQFCTVRDEVEFINNYFTIQSKRYEGIVDFRTEVQDDLMDCRVVSMVLQPLVENAINHGMRHTKSGGHIQISIKKEKDALVYRVADNGMGACEHQIRAMLCDKTGRKGFALRNVDRRIKLHYGNSYGLEFHSEPGCGTEIIVVQPCLLDIDSL